MKNFIRKFLCVLLTAIFCFAALPACGKNNEPEEKTNKIHDFSYTETENYVVRDGATGYKVALPENVSTEINYARNELVNLFKEATGVTLDVVSGANLTHSAENKYISLGKTGLYESSGLSVDFDSLKSDGVRIITKDNTIYLLGGTDTGVLNAVYDFLNLNFNFETYSKDCYVIDKNVRNVKLMNYDVTDVPDIDYRCRGASGILYATSEDYDDVMYSYRLRTVDAYWKRSIPIHEGDRSSKSAADHNCFYYLPTNVYLEDNPEFYSTKNPKGQLCYTARGNAEKYELMTTYCAEKIEQSLKFYPREQYPLYTAAQLGIADNTDMCGCDECKRVSAKHNDAIVATIIPFLKDVAKKVNAWMELPENEPYKRENFQYMFFAYWDTLTAPFTYDEKTKTYVAADNSVLSEGLNVIPFLAINRVDHSYSIYDDKNATIRSTLDAWLTYYKNAWCWTYGCFYQDYFAFYDCYNYYTDSLKYMSDHDMKMVAPQLHSSQRGADTGFFTMAAYVFAKLSWDSSLKMQTLIDNYMSAMFREAAEPMNKMFTEARLWHARARLEFNWTWTSWQTTPVLSAGYIEYGYVNKLFGYLDEAYDIIKKYENNPALYAKLKNRIDVEWLYPAMTVINNFETKFTEADFTALGKKFKQICIDNGITHVSESGSITSLLQSL